MIVRCFKCKKPKDIEEIDQCDHCHAYTCFDCQVVGEEYDNPVTCCVDKKIKEGLDNYESHACSKVD